MCTHSGSQCHCSACSRAVRVVTAEMISHVYDSDDEYEEDSEDEYGWRFDDEEVDFNESEGEEE